MEFLSFLSQDIWRSQSQFLLCKSFLLKIYVIMEIIQSSIVIIDSLPKIANKTFPMKTTSRK